MSDNEKPEDKSTGEKKCFVIAPIGEELSETRKRSNQVLKHVITPAVQSRGYKAIRADQIDKPGLITSQVIQCIVNDPLVIADLTETNPNVFYELAIRHAIRKPLVQIIQKGERIPFDVAGLRTIQFDHQDLDSVSSAKEEIEKQIDELEANPTEMETPISVSHELLQLRQSENPDDRNFAELIEGISELRSIIMTLFEKRETLQQGSYDHAVRILIRKLDEMSEMGELDFIKRRQYSKKYYPRMLEEWVMDSDMNETKPMLIVILASQYKELAPWIYEIGMEAYRQVIKNPHGTMQEDYISQFKIAIEEFIRKPYFREVIMENKKNYYVMEFTERMIDRLSRT